MIASCAEAALRDSRMPRQQTYSHRLALIYSRSNPLLSSPQGGVAVQYDKAPASRAPVVPTKWH